MRESRKGKMQVLESIDPRSKEGPPVTLVTPTQMIARMTLVRVKPMSQVTSILQAIVPEHSPNLLTKRGSKKNQKANKVNDLPPQRSLNFPQVAVMTVRPS